MADQGLVSAGSFLFNLVLARSAGEREFGIAVLAIGGLYLLQSVQRSLIIYPLSLRIAGGSAKEVRRLASSAAALSAPLSLLLGLVAGIVALILTHSASLAAILVVLVVASQTHELLRWTSLAQVLHRKALAADLVRHGAAVSALVVLSYHRGISTEAAFACLTGGAMLGSAWQIWCLRLSGWGADYIRILAGDAWRIGRWDLVGSSVASVSAQVLPWSLAAWQGVRETAHLQAVANLLGATHPVLMGFGNLITPAVAQAAAAGRKDVRPVGVQYGAIGFLVLAPYLATLMAIPRTVLSLVYGGSSDYAAETAALRWFVAIYAILFTQQAAQAVLSGLGRSRIVSVVSVTGLCLQFAIVLPLAAVRGLTAACAGVCIVSLVECTLALRFLSARTGPAASPSAETSLA